jgi:hypothetical protein
MDTGEPLKKARVTLESRGSEAFSDSQLTDDQGHFLFDNAPPGPYDMEVAHNGFVDAEYGQKKPGAPGAILTLSGGQRLTDLVFKLSRAASISGQVFDEDGQPLAKAEIIAFRASKRAGKEHRANFDANSTNDLGEFRVFGLAPGRYFLAVNYRSQERLEFRSKEAMQKGDPGYVTTYFPNTTDPAKAQSISVNPGDEIRSVDFILRPTRSFTVSGKVIADGSVNNFAWGTVSLSPRGSGLVDAAQDLRDNFQFNDGRFAIRDVPPGSYDLLTIWSDLGPGSGPHVQSREMDVTASDVDNLVLRISRGFEIAGHLTWDGPAGKADGFFIRLYPLGESPYTAPGQTVKPDGTFLFKDVSEGTYRVILAGPEAQKNYYLKSARYGTSFVTDTGFSPQSGSDATLEIVVGSHGPAISGEVLSTNSLPGVGATVVLIPEPPNRNLRFRYVSRITDQNGKFSMSGISPGDYKLFSWDSAEESDDQYGEDWFDAEWLKPYESEGQAIHLEEGDQKSVSLKVIEVKSSSP